jgi:ribosome-associated heat shock protein Hsp15
VAVGDVLTIAVARTTALVRVEGLGERRGPAPEARLLYTEVARDDGSLVLEPGRS